MHDIDRMRSKIELRLGASQLVGLALGTTVFSALLFAAGFMIGKGQAPTVAPAPDLNQLLDASSEEAEAPKPVTAAMGEVEFLFPNALGERPTAQAPEKRKVMRLPVATLVATPEAEPRPVKVAKKVGQRQPTQVQRGVAGKSLFINKAAPVKPKRVAPIITAAKVQAAPKPQKSSLKGAAALVVSPPKVLKPTVKQAPQNTAAKMPSKGIQKKVTTAAEKSDARARRNTVARGKAATPVRKAAVTKPPASSKSIVSAKKRTPRRTNMGKARFTLQVKATRDKAVADNFVKTLQKAGFYPHRVLISLPRKGRFYRIRVGRFETIEEARAFQRSYSERSGMSDGGFVTRL